MSVDVTVRGALEVRTYGRSQKAIRLVSCPFCEHDFVENEPRWKHFLDEHGPEDAGLSPLNERPHKLVTDGGQDASSRHATGISDPADGFQFQFAEPCDECAPSRRFDARLSVGSPGASLPNLGLRVRSMSAFIAWAASDGVDVNGVHDARMELRFGPDTDWPEVRHAISRGFRLWQEVGMPEEAYR